MEVREAINQISEIHNHLERSQIYRGYRSVPIALSGIVAFIGASLQPHIIDTANETACILFWLKIAIINIGLCGSSIVTRYFSEPAHARRQTRKVVGQFLPSIAAAALVTILFLRIDARLAFILPGLWTILFGIGIFASRPYLPRTIGWIALFYFISGCAMLIMAEDGTSLSPWVMACTYGIGQIAAAIVLYWHIERKDNV